MPLKAHADCEVCNRPRGPFTPSQFTELFGTVASTKEQVEYPPELVAAGARVDGLVEAHDAAKSAWEEVHVKAQRLHSSDPRRFKVQALRDEARAEWERLGDELRDARITYHRLKQTFDRERHRSEYLASVAAREAERDGEREQSNRSRRSRFKQVIGSDKELR